MGPIVNAVLTALCVKSSAIAFDAAVKMAKGFFKTALYRMALSQSCNG